MRVLFLAPLLTSKITNQLAELANCLVAVGHEIQILARKVTRVQTAKGLVLSRNDSCVENLRNRVGIDRVTLLHSHVSRKSFPTEAGLDEVDEQRTQGWIELFCPDVVVLSGDDLVMDDPVIHAFKKSPPTPAELRLRQGSDGDWLLSAAHDDVSLKIATTRRALQKDLHANFPRLVGRIGSNQKHIAVLERERSQLNDLIKGAATKPPISVATTGTFKNESLPEVKGELESIKEEDVIFGQTLWVKGWIDWSPHLAIQEVEVLINDHSHRIVPKNVRGEIAENLKNPYIVGFDVRLPLNAGGPPLRVALVLIHKDGRKQVWQRRNCWANDCIPSRHTIPIILGQAIVEPSLLNWSEEHSSNWLRGTVRIDENNPQKIVALQRGKQVACLQLETRGDLPKLNNQKHVEFTFNQALSRETYNPSLPLDIWIEFHDDHLVHWLRCNPLCDTPVEPLHWSLNELQSGTVIQGDSINCTAGPIKDGLNPEIFVNGQRVDTVRTPSQEPAYWSLTIPVAQAGNDIQIHVECGAEYQTLQVWRHIEAPRISQLCAVVVPPASSVASVLPFAANGKSRSILVIRKAPSPTDELYVLAPLSILESAGLVQIKTIELDTDFDNPVKTDKLLTTGTSVVVSRYISDRWIAAITRRKQYLGPIIYLMDDDVAAAIDTHHLPGGYRRRMIKVACGEFQSMIKLCDYFIVTSQNLFSRYSSQKTDLIEPPYLHPPKNLKHLYVEDEITITYQGTEGHRDDLSAIAPALRSIHDSYPHVRLQIIIGNLRFVPHQLKGLARCEVIPPMPWPEYKKFRATASAHIALAPILDTPYNRGKSIVKIFDISSLGAAGIYSNSPPYNAVIEHGVNGILLENDPQMWFKTIKWLIERPEEIRRLANESQKLALEIGDLSRLRDYWTRKLGLKAQYA